MDSGLWDSIMQDADFGDGEAWALRQAKVKAYERDAMLMAVKGMITDVEKVGEAKPIMDMLAEMAEGLAGVFDNEMEVMASPFLLAAEQGKDTVRDFLIGDARKSFGSQVDWQKYALSMAEAVEQQRMSVRLLRGVAELLPAVDMPDEPVDPVDEWLLVTDDINYKAVAFVAALLIGVTKVGMPLGNLVDEMPPEISVLMGRFIRVYGRLHEQFSPAAQAVMEG